ncbi:hypothetical protein PL81_35840 [Streptomyces sp. RSD-27]|nr:hypothetical protein PL81_35840 [Streptomyces sp. RSD-27]
MRGLFPAAVSVLLVFAVGAAAVAFDRRRAAVRERDTVLYQQILAHADRLHDVDLAARLAQFAGSDSDAVDALAFSPDGLPARHPWAERVTDRARP